MKNENKYHESEDQNIPPQHIQENEWWEHSERPASFDLKTKAYSLLEQKNYPDAKHQFLELSITNAKTHDKVIKIIKSMENSPDRVEGMRWKDIKPRLDNRINREK